MFSRVTCVIFFLFTCFLARVFHIITTAAILVPCAYALSLSLFYSISFHLSFGFFFIITIVVVGEKKRDPTLVFKQELEKSEKKNRSLTPETNFVVLLFDCLLFCFYDLFYRQ